MSNPISGAYACYKAGFLKIWKSRVTQVFGLIAAIALIFQAGGTGAGILLALLVMWGIGSLIILWPLSLLLLIARRPFEETVKVNTIAIGALTVLLILFVIIGSIAEGDKNRNRNTETAARANEVSRIIAKREPQIPRSNQVEVTPAVSDVKAIVNPAAGTPATRKPQNTDRRQIQYVEVSRKTDDEGMKYTREVKLALTNVDGVSESSLRDLLAKLLDLEIKSANRERDRARFKKDLWIQVELYASKELASQNQLSALAHGLHATQNVTESLYDRQITINAPNIAALSKAAEPYLGLSVEEQQAAFRSHLAASYYSHAYTGFNRIIEPAKELPVGYRLTLTAPIKLSTISRRAFNSASEEERVAALVDMFEIPAGYEIQIISNANVSRNQEGLEEWYFATVHHRGQTAPLRQGWMNPGAISSQVTSQGQAVMATGLNANALREIFERRAARYYGLSDSQFSRMWSLGKEFNWSQKFTDNDAAVFAGFIGSYDYEKGIVTLRFNENWAVTPSLAEATEAQWDRGLYRDKIATAAQWLRTTTWEKQSGLTMSDQKLFDASTRLVDKLDALIPAATTSTAVVHQKHFYEIIKPEFAP